MTDTAPAPPSRILVVDDEPDLRTLYELTLLREGYLVDTAASVAQARARLRAGHYELLITDMRMPDGSGIDVLRSLREQQRPERCIVITAYGSADNAVESLKAGAFDYLTKPVDLKQFRSAVAAALHAGVTPPATPDMSGSTGGTESVSTQPPNRRAASAAGQLAFARMAGDSAAMRGVRERIARVAHSMAPVMICGESGTGKELVAQALHANSHRSAGPWVAVNCGAIPENLLEAEFFGAKKGAYTGATQDRPGFFQAAHGGTLFLDEIGDLPVAMQAKLLRAIQERRVRPLGTSQEVATDVRIVSATHKNLPAEVQAGRFRQDLFYRLNVIEIIMPALRERLEDLPALCTALLERIAAETGMAARQLSPAALLQLRSLPLPGNVRELENLLHRAVALSDADALELHNIAPLHARTDTGESMPAELASATVPAALAALPHDLQSHLDAQERAILLRALHETGFNRTLASKLLGLSLRQVRYRMERLKIDVPDYPPDAGHD